MPIPFATTTISVLDPTVPDGDLDGYPDEERVYAPTSTGIRAVVSVVGRSAASGGSTIRDGSEQTLDLLKLVADVCTIQHTSRVLDEQTGIVYRIEWLVERMGFGLDHVSAGMSLIEGFNP